MTTLRVVPYGPAATLALRDAIVDAKQGDPLAPVTVAVPSNYAGLSLRRSLGLGELSLSAVSGRDGIVNVRFIVLARVAELLGAPSLAAEQRRPFTGAVRAEAIRAALAEDPGVFRDVAEHTATERSLDATLRDLRRSPQSVLPAIERQGARAATVVRAYRSVRKLSDRYYDEEDLLDAAAEAVRAGSPALRDVGHVIVHLPRRLSPSEHRFIAALGSAGGLTVLIGQTGDEVADAPAGQLVASLEEAFGAADRVATPDAPVATEIVAVTDAEEEVRFALRLVSERLAGGVPLHRIAVLYPTAQPYALLTHEQFEAAGMPHNAPAVQTLAQTMAGRTLLGLLRLRELDFRRDAVMDWLSAGPVLEHRGRDPAPAHRWDTLSRTAGIVAGPAQWQDRLRRHSRSVLQRREALERREDAPEGQIRGLTIELDHAQRLASFIAELTASVQPERGWNWAEFAGWARKLLEQYLGGEGHRRDWPEHEVEAYRKIEGALETLAHLDDIRPQTDESTFRRALERELDAPASRLGRFGDCVFTGRIRDAMGTSFDVVILLGMSEGLVPPRGRDDPLLPDSERRAAGEGIPLRTDRRAEDRRDYLAALAVAPERLLVYPRADLRGQRAKLPARWLLESASALAGQRLYSADLDKRPSPAWLTIVPSFEGALAADGAPASSQEYGLRSLLRWKRDGRQIAGHYLAVADGASALRNGFDAGLARLSSRLTRWDGSIGEAGDLMPTADRAISPTALQNWAACPRKYLLGNVLHIAETLSPEETLRISPIDRGNLLHTALERFIREMLPVQEDQPWTEDQRLRLRQIGAELCDEAEASGSTGKPVLWRLDRERIMRDLEGFLDADEELRREFGVVPWDAEFAFGVQDSDRPPVIADLDATRKIAFRGRIDRVDRAPDGSRLLVLDYKSGSALPFGNLDKDPVKSGTLLQLPIYALAAQQAHGQVPTDSYYWFATEQWDYKRAGYPVTEERLERFRSALVTIVDGIGAGLFPARPGPTQQGTYVNCMFCPYTRVCPSDKARAWERKRGAPELAQYVTLSEGGPDQ